MRQIQIAAKTGALTTDDPNIVDALFLHRHAGWKPEDLGYPPRDYILIDLMRYFE